MECRNPEYDGWYEARYATCYYRMAVETEQQKLNRKKDYTPEPGRLMYAELNKPH